MKGKNAAIIVGAAAGVGGLALFLLSRRAGAAPPPGGYVCPYCRESFATYEELVAHVQSVHPGERIPLPIEWE